MKSTQGLIQSAGALAEQGLTSGESANELNVSRETAGWLIEQSGNGVRDVDVAGSPVDVHVDWSAIGADSGRLSHLGAIMADLLASSTEIEEIDLTVGIGKSGGPLATVVSNELETGLSVYMPSKYQHDADSMGSFSHNFSPIEDRACFIVDDNIDTGGTMTETIEQVRDHDGDPRAAVVLTDKLGEDEIDGVPIYSLVEIFQMSED
jgi:orotate phosphoribosyltransferase